MHGYVHQTLPLLDDRLNRVSFLLAAQEIPEPAANCVWISSLRRVKPVRVELSLARKLGTSTPEP